MGLVVGSKSAAGTPLLLCQRLCGRICMEERTIWGRERVRKEGGAGFPANVLHFGQLLSRGQLIELGRGRGVKMGLPLYPPPGGVGWGGGMLSWKKCSLSQHETERKKWGESGGGGAWES